MNTWAFQVAGTTEKVAHPSLGLHLWWHSLTRQSLTSLFTPHHGEVQVWVLGVSITFLYVFYLLLLYTWRFIYITTAIQRNAQKKIKHIQCCELQLSVPQSVLNTTILLIGCYFTLSAQSNIWPYRFSMLSINYREVIRAPRFISDFYIWERDKSELKLA